MVRERSGHLAKPLHNGLLSKLAVFALFNSLSGATCERVAPERCLVWGPGLNPDVVVPVRYFFIQAANSNGENLTVSPGKNKQKQKPTNRERHTTRVSWFWNNNKKKKHNGDAC